MQQYQQQVHSKLVLLTKGNLPKLWGGLKAFFVDYAQHIRSPVKAETANTAMTCQGGAALAIGMGLRISGNSAAVAYSYRCGSISCHAPHQLHSHGQLTSDSGGAEHLRQVELQQASWWSKSKASKFVCLVHLLCHRCLATLHAFIVAVRSVRDLRVQQTGSGQDKKPHVGHLATGFM